jgi:predicted small integral membrane protein
VKHNSPSRLRPCERLPHVRFTPQSGHQSDIAPCPLSAKSGVSFDHLDTDGRMARPSALCCATFFTFQVPDTMKKLGGAGRADGSTIMVPIRLTKVILIASLAAYALIVTYDNIVDYDSNYEFVRHVLSMDTTFPGNELMDRAITNRSAWTAVYGLIIAVEGLTGLLLAIGALLLLFRLTAPAVIFNGAKIWAVAGMTVGFGLWFFGFLVVAGEYFAMWQSTTWNGQEAAFRIAVVILGMLVFVSLPDSDRA